MKLTKTKRYNNIFSYDSKKGTLYAFRFSYYDLVGKRHEKQQRGYQTELAAHKAELALEVQFADNDIQQIMDSSMTVAKWADTFVEMYKRHWRPATLAAYTTCINKYVIPLLGNMRLDSLTKANYDYRFIQPQLDNLTPGTIKAHHRIAMTLINAAVENDILPRNKMTRMRFKPAEQGRAFEQEDLKKFNAQLSSLKPEFQVLFTLLELTGMRKGEALALTWEDINFKKETIRINKTRSYFGVGPTKTAAGNRTIAIATTLVKKLKRHRLMQREKCLHTMDEFTDKLPVFTSVTNRPIAPQIAYYHFNRAIKLAGIDPGKYVIHSLRHTHATYLLNSGMNLVDVSRRLGHSNPSVTLNIYAHAVKGNDRALAEKIAKIAEL